MTRRPHWLRAVGGILAGISLLATTAVTVVVNASVSGATPASWAVSASYPAPPQGVVGVACPSAADCYAVGWNTSEMGDILATTDSGSTWVTQTIPSGTTFLNGIACPSIADCYAVGSYAVLSTTDSGTTWVTQTTPAGAGLNDIACPSTSQCYAVGGGSVVTTTDSGASWVSQSVPSGVSDLNGVACPSTTDCFAVGQNTSGAGLVLTTTDSGATWASQTVPAGVAWLLRVSCPSSTNCYAVGYGGSSVGSVAVATTDSGVTWVNQTVPAGLGYLSGVECPSTSDCYAVGGTGSPSASPPTGVGAVLATTNSGATWVSETVPAGANGFYRLACPSPSDCYVTGGTSDNLGVIFATSDSGTTWQSQAVPSGVAKMTSVTCPSAVECAAVGAGSSGGVVFVTMGGWVSRTVPSGVADLNGVDCPSTTDCYAVGLGSTGDGLIIATTDGGATWVGQTLPSGVADLDGVDCPSTTDCYAVGQSTTGLGAILSSTDSGSSWVSQTVPTGVADLSSVTCLSSMDCDAAGEGSSGGVVLNTTDAGSSWVSQTIPSASGVPQLKGVACSSTTDCYAVGLGSTGLGLIIATTDGGATWVSQTIPSEVSDLEGVTCSASSDCYAVGESTSGFGVVLALADSGSAWVTQTIPSEVASLSGVTCSLNGDCYSVGSGTGTEGGLVLSHAQIPTVTSVSPSSGSINGGTIVTIVGANLAGATAVDFGGSPATDWTLLTPTQVSAVAPAHSVGTVDVTVTTPGGATATGSADQFTYIYSAFTAVTPYRICDTRSNGNNTPCAGEPVSAGETYTLPEVAGTNPPGMSSGGVPASGVTAVVLNVTATGEEGQGYLTVWPSSVLQPIASSLNYRAERTAAALVTVEVSPTSQLRIYSSQSTDLVVDVEGYYAAPSGTAGLFNAVTPYRICDTRGTNGLTGTDAQCAGHTLSAGVPLSIEVSGTDATGTISGGVPTSGVSAVVVNVTAIGHGRGYVTAYPGGVSPPRASNLNFSSGQVTPNRVIVPLGANGQISLVSNSSVDVLVDVNGWFTDGSSDAQTGALFAATTPSRICDTRSNTNTTTCAGETLTTRTPLTVAVAGQGPVPATGVVAVVASVTVADTTAQSYLTTWPTGEPQPTASDLNWVSGLTVANMAEVGLGTGGDISVYVNNGSADVIVDVDGYYVNAP